MAQHRYRQNKIKREHTIIDGVLPILEQIAALPHVQAITPGRINQRSGNRAEGITFQYHTETGLKLLARSSRAVQEVFVVSDKPQDVLRALHAKGLVATETEASETTDASEKKASAPSDSAKTDSPKSDSPKSSSPSKRPGKPRRPRKGRSRSTGTSPQGNRAGSQGSSATAEPGAPQQTNVEPQTPETSAPPHKARPEVQDALPEEIREKMLDLIEGKPPKPDKDGKAKRTRKRSQAHGPGERTRTDAGAPDTDVSKPSTRGALWRELLQRHRALQELEARRSPSSADPDS